MNVIIANEQKEKFNELNFEVIKRLDGEFEVDEIISSFQNIFYNKMILDITSLKNYKDINTLQKLTISLDVEKLILVLPEGDEVSLPSYLSKLISLGIYNFTTNIEGINYLYNNTNTYRDVAQYHHIIEPEVQTIVKTVEVPIEGPVQYVTQEINKAKILGLKSVTKEAGATTLSYMIKNSLKNTMDVVCIEVDKNDYAYFRDDAMISATDNNIIDVVKQNINKNLIVIDVNNSAVAENICGTVLYLIEPSTIKINKMLRLKPNILKELKGKKIVLVKSSLNQKDIKDFSYESNLDVFFNLPALDERKKNDEITELLQKLDLI